jgi:hypothetical protein
MDALTQIKLDLWMADILKTIYQRCEDLKNIGETRISVDMVQFIIENGLRGCRHDFTKNRDGVK